ncbi:MAG: UDP-N-acetylmuramate dehydrogenase [Candidatus Omnitrophica bacterium]|nr:UDP-N-acetylmuramate dehydrogenase [Candidatus Omnitrophota bacterium]
MMKHIPNARLSDYTTFQLGGPCSCLIECQSPDDLQKTIATLSKNKTPFILIGGGSNLVVSDSGVTTAVIRYLSEEPLIERVGNEVIVSASTILDDLALFCVSEGLTGLNYTTGIPGTVGGAVVGNAGAWGKQVGDVLSSAVILDKSGNSKQVDRSYFAFQYRHSHLKESDEIVASVSFTLTPADPLVLAKERSEIVKLRAEKHPDLTRFPCAGSFFRNIEPTPKADRRQVTGGFLEDAGGKHLKVGGAQIFEKHANIIVKGPGCTAQDVFDLHLQMMKVVKDKFDLQLNREVRFVGDFRDHKHEGFW